MKRHECFTVLGKPFFSVGGQLHNSSSYALGAAGGENICRIWQLPLPALRRWERISLQYRYAGMHWNRKKAFLTVIM